MRVAPTVPHGAVRQALWNRIRHKPGTTEDCPTCGQTVCVRRRPLNAGQARSMIKLYRLDPDGTGKFFHLPTHVGSKDREEGKLTAWGLIEEEGIARADGGRAGYWRLTTKGRRFVRGEIRLPRHALFYNRKCLGLDNAETVDIHDVLGYPFDLRDLKASE